MKAEQAILCSLLALVSVSPVWSHEESAPGALDDDFGDHGRVLSDLGGSESMRGVAVQSNEKIVVVGTAFKAGITKAHDVFIARYDANGVLDPAFGSGGFIYTDFGAEDSANAVVIQPDGNIVIAGDSIASNPGSQTLIIARYLPDGTLDPNFAGSGQRNVDVGGFIAVKELALDPQGRLVVLGSHGATSPFEVGSNVAVVRFNSDGTLDSSFDDDGILIKDNGGSELAASLFILPDPNGDTPIDGNVPGAQATDPPTYAAVWGDHSGDHWLFAITENGGPVPSFGDQGSVTVDLGFHDFSDGLTMLPCGDYVASGVTFNEPFTSGSAHMFYFQSDGTQTRLIDALGKTVLGTASVPGPIDVALAPNGHVFLATAADGKFISALFDPNGVLDPGYGVDGVASHRANPGAPAEDFTFFAGSAMTTEFAILAGLTGNFNVPNSEDTIMLKIQIHDE